MWTGRDRKELRRHDLKPELREGGRRERREERTTREDDERGRKPVGNTVPIYTASQDSQVDQKRVHFDCRARGAQK
jgi:hypothetical protein